MKRLCLGLLAHVDAGKTTLSEALLYASGALRRLGRVDHGDAFLDTDDQERRRGITIFSKQAALAWGETELTLVDTPGHVDFSAEMERTLQVLDCAVLVISGTDGVQAHTLTLWQLLERYGVPVVLFINKMDLAGADRSAILAGLQQRLSSACVDMESEARHESAAMCDEAALEEFLEGGELSEGTWQTLIARRRVFPCYFGAALKLQGVEELLRGLGRYAPVPRYGEAFAARVYKISRDSRGERLTWMKITGGALRPKTVLTGEGWSEKADQLRSYSGEKFRLLEVAESGSVVAVTGLSHTYPGQGLGAEQADNAALLEPVFHYCLQLPEGIDPHAALPRLRQLEEEDPALRLLWDEARQEIHIHLMGDVQLEVLQEEIRRRFGWAVTFGEGAIVYKETVAKSVYGCGHFEPLRHYAEVHLRLDPLPAGSGVVAASECSTDALDLNWQRLILTHILERRHPGVLTGAPLTDVKITLLAGRAHVKHTEGGDFRQATYRAIRQALMGAESVLLEPWYDFRLELPAASVGRAMTDIQSWGGTVESPETLGDTARLVGSAPVVRLRNYARELAVYTRGEGRLSLTAGGYHPCAQQADVVAALGYDPLRDVDNPPDSVFCSHGAGVIVPWEEAPDRMHLPLPGREREEEAVYTAPRRTTAAGDKELQEIFERTYGKVERRDFRPPPKVQRTELKESYEIRGQTNGEDYLLVDGYNIIFAWPELKELSAHDLSAARGALENVLADYRAFRRCHVILVFDAYKVKRNPGSVEKRHGLHIVYTKEAETADMYIEKTSYRLQKGNRVRVATSDGLEQLIVLGHGALRLSADALRAEVEEARGQIREILQRSNRENRGENRPRLKK